MTTTRPRRHERRFLASTLLGAFAGGFVATAVAQDLERQQSLPVGEAALYPSLRVDYLYDDNIGLLPSDEVDGSSVLLRPRLDFLADRRLLTVRAAYEGQFSQGSEDALDYADHRVTADVDAEFGTRRRGSLGIAVDRSHEDLGLELTRGLGRQFDEPVMYNTTSLGGEFVYGAESARGNLVFGLGLVDRSYTNLPEVTAGRDYTSVQPYAAFSYRIGGGTRAVLRVDWTQYDFDDDFRDDSDDRDEAGASIGLRFSPTGKIRGGFRVGVSNASYSESDIEDETLFTANADVDYLIREYSTISLELSREFDNLSPTTSAPGENQSVRTRGELGWDHAWSDRFRTNAFAAVSLVDRACPSIPTDLVSTGLEADVAIRRWLDVGAGATFSSRTADDCPAGLSNENPDDLDFDRLVYGVHLRATL